VNGAQVRDLGETGYGGADRCAGSGRHCSPLRGVLYRRHLFRDQISGQRSWHFIRVPTRTVVGGMQIHNLDNKVFVIDEFLPEHDFTLARI
jgi:hypothetical protein